MTEVTFTSHHDKSSALLAAGNQPNYHAASTFKGVLQHSLCLAGMHAFHLLGGYGHSCACSCSFTYTHNGHSVIAGLRLL